MFDLSLGKILLIAVIALIILGPERLPSVARTVGALIGRAQRFIAGIKEEVHGLDFGSPHADMGKTANIIRSHMESDVNKIKQSLSASPPGKSHAVLIESAQQLGGASSQGKSGSFAEIGIAISETGSLPAQFPDFSGDPAKVTINECQLDLFAETPPSLASIASSHE